MNDILAQLEANNERIRNDPKSQARRRKIHAEVNRENRGVLIFAIVFLTVLLAAAYYWLRAIPHAGFIFTVGWLASAAVLIYTYQPPYRR